MIEFNAFQLAKVKRRQARSWMEQMAQAWYQPDNPDKAYHSTEAFLQTLQSVYHTALTAGIDDMEVVCLLGFDVLRAQACGWSEEGIRDLAQFLLSHAEADNTAYAQRWIEFCLEEI